MLSVRTGEQQLRFAEAGVAGVEHDVEVAEGARQPCPEPKLGIGGGFGGDGLTAMGRDGRFVRAGGRDQAHRDPGGASSLECLSACARDAGASGTPGEAGGDAREGRSDGSFGLAPRHQSRDVDEEVFTAGDLDKRCRAAADNVSESFEFVQAVACIVGKEAGPGNAVAGLGGGHTDQEAAGGGIAGGGSDEGILAVSLEEDEGAALEFRTVAEGELDGKAGEEEAENSHDILLLGFGRIEHLF